MEASEFQAQLDQQYPAGAVVRLLGDGRTQDFKTTGLTVVRMRSSEIPEVRFWDSSVNVDYLVGITEYKVLRTAPVQQVRISTEEGLSFMLGGGLKAEEMPEGWLLARANERQVALQFTS